MTTSEQTEDFSAALAQPPAKPRGPGAWLISRVGRRLRAGTLALALPDGGGLVLRGALPGPDARIEVHSWRALLRVVLTQGIGFAEIAARDYGLRVTALTLSREQLAYARQRVAAAGLDDRVEVRYCDYRDIDGCFDHVVSIEMMEAVGEAYWPVYFQRIADVLVPGGRAAIQVITIDDALFARYRRRPDFIQSQVFPGGMLPTTGIVTNLATARGLCLRDDFAFGRHYARTLAAWRARFQAAGDAIGALGHDRCFRRRWSFYLAYCEGGFSAGRIDVRQMLFEKPEVTR